MNAFIELHHNLLLLGTSTLTLVLVVCYFLQIKLIKSQQSRLIEQQNLLHELMITERNSQQNLQQQLHQSLNANQQQILQQHQHFSNKVEQQVSDLKMKLLRQNAEQAEKQQSTLHEHQLAFNQNQLKAVEQIMEQLNKSAKSNREEQALSLKQSSEQMAQSMEKLSESTDKRLKDISLQVEKRLADGFEKTTKTFNDILKRLVLIDDAQKKITELSSNVVSLQEVLADKRSRGAFGEVQLNALIRNVIPEKHFEFQHTLSNGKVADCILFLPQPTGNVVIDAKFPLESYRKMTDISIGEHDRKKANSQFKQDIKKHINDISEKYLIEKETSDGALMFLPAEAIFAEIHGHYQELVEYANKKRVWLVSPTTLMAILTTARAVIKDKATQEQVHIIQEHLSHLASDFSRFRVRFDNLAKHIDQAAVDVKQIHTSANKITTRFEKIEQVDVKSDNQKEELLEQPLL